MARLMEECRWYQEHFFKCRFGAQVPRFEPHMTIYPVSGNTEVRKDKGLTKHNQETTQTKEKQK